jgi:hypothetical protein
MFRIKNLQVIYVNNKNQWQFTNIIIIIIIIIIYLTQQ